MRSTKKAWFTHEIFVEQLVMFLESNSISLKKQLSMLSEIGQEKHKKVAAMQGES